MTQRDIVYLIMDELRNSTDDVFFEERHIMAYMSKYRAFLLKQKYADLRKTILQANYSVVCLDLERAEGMFDLCGTSPYMRTVEPVLDDIGVGTQTVSSTSDFFDIHFSFVEPSRFKYVGHNKWTRNFIYVTMGPDGRLYFSGGNNMLFNMKSIMYSYVGSDLEFIANHTCSDNSEEICEYIDTKFPLEDSLVPNLIQLIVSELRYPKEQPVDENNNARDDNSSTVNQ